MKYSIEQFIEKFKPVINHLDPNAGFNGWMYETYGQELYHVQSIASALDTMKKVWTIIEGDEGSIVYSAGYHLVNRLGYIITENYWEDADDYVELDEVSDIIVDPEDPNNWETIELFSFLKLTYVIAMEEVLEEWINSREQMIQMTLKEFKEYENNHRV